MTYRRGRSLEFAGALWERLVRSLSLRRTTSTPFCNKAPAQAGFSRSPEAHSERFSCRVRACRGDAMALPKKLDQDGLGDWCLESLSSATAVYGRSGRGSMHPRGNNLVV